MASNQDATLRAAKQRHRGSAPLKVIIFVLIFGGSSLFSCLRLQQYWKSTWTKFIPSQLQYLATTSITHGIDSNRMMHRRKRYNQLYQYHSPSSSQTEPDSSCGAAPEFGVYFNQTPKLRSSNNEDATLNKLFSNLFQEVGRNGTYVEMGAYDGVQESNSRFFDVCLGWSGLLIEANPTMYQRLLQNRPNAHRMSFAPSCNATDEINNKTLQFHDYPHTNAGLAGNALAYKDKHVVDVPCGSLTPVLEDFLDGHVDFFSLDVEGSEPSVVDNIDFDRVFIEMLMVEHSNAFCSEYDVCESRDRVRARLQQANYTRYSHVIRKSDLYIHAKSKYKLRAGEYATIGVGPHIRAGSA